MHQLWGAALANERVQTSTTGAAAEVGSADTKARVTAAPDPLGRRMTSFREVSSPCCAKHGLQGRNAKMRAPVDGMRAAVGLARRAV